MRIMGAVAAPSLLLCLEASSTSSSSVNVSFHASVSNSFLGARRPHPPDKGKGRVMTRIGGGGEHRHGISSSGPGPGTGLGLGTGARAGAGAGAGAGAARELLRRRAENSPRGGGGGGVLLPLGGNRESYGQRQCSSSSSSGLHWSNNFAARSSSGGGGGLFGVGRSRRRRKIGATTRPSSSWSFVVTSATAAAVGEPEQEQEEEQEQEDGALALLASAPEAVRVPTQRLIALLAGWQPPRYLWRSFACLIIAGQVIIRIIRGKIHLKNTIQQLETVGPQSLGVSLLTASFVGMVFTIQFVREFARLGLTRSVGGVLALALARELSPVVTAIILAGRVGSAFAAELGTMQVSEQTDTLRVLRTDPIDYLITPRVIACCISLPILTIICFTVGMAASVLLADSVYGVSSNIILESAARALQPWDLVSTSIKSTVFGGIISTVSCSWGVTTSGGAKGVGESTTSAVVISLVCIFIADFVLSYAFFQGAGDALKAAMG